MIAAPLPAAPPTTNGTASQIVALSAAAAPADRHQRDRADVVAPQPDLPERDGGEEAAERRGPHRSPR